MDSFNALSSREREVVKLLLEGKSNKAIASALHITDNTVEFHLKNIYSKYQVGSRTELVVKLRDSVVVNGEEIAENRDRLNSSNWSKFLRAAVSNIGKEFRMESVSSTTNRSGAGPMTFFESLRTCLAKYAEFNGRASRSEFWWFFLFVILAASAFNYISQAAGNIFLIAILLPLLSAGTRRLRDSGKSAWWQLFILAPVAGIVVVGYLWTLPSISPQTEDTMPG
jgi:DNA-binding CsgD family transcriptional regulator